jgi:hypothetical protein
LLPLSVVLGDPDDDGLDERDAEEEYAQRQSRDQSSVVSPLSLPPPRRESAAAVVVRCRPSSSRNVPSTDDLAASAWCVSAKTRPIRCELMYDMFYDF